MTTTTKAPMPIQRNIRMKRGADWRMTIFVKEDDLVTPKSTTGWSVTMTIKASANGDQYDQLTVGNGITNTAAEGKLAFERLAASIDGYDFTRAIYDIIITDADTKKTCPFYGDVELIP